MDDFIKAFRNWKVWLLIFILIIILPTLINFLILRSYIWPTAGEPKDWLIFWATYMSGSGTFLVVFITIKNHKELKTQQVKTIKYSIEKGKLEDLINQLAVVTNLFNDSFTYANIVTLKRNASVIKLKIKLAPEIESKSQYLNALNKCLEFANIYIQITASCELLKRADKSARELFFETNNEALRNLEVAYNEARNRYLTDIHLDDKEKETIQKCSNGGQLIDILIKIRDEKYKEKNRLVEELDNSTGYYLESLDKAIDNILIK